MVLCSVVSLECVGLCGNKCLPFSNGGIVLAHDVSVSWRSTLEISDLIFIMWIRFNPSTSWSSEVFIVGDIGPGFSSYACDSLEFV